MEVDSIMKMLVLVLKPDSQYLKESVLPKLDTYYYEKCHSYMVLVELIVWPKVSILKDDQIIFPHCMGRPHLEYLLTIKIMMYL
jgi:hypothetical protein